jgi:pimeloyl-ACP methyl ester carboxylesterase
LSAITPASYQVELSDVSLRVTEWPGSGDPVLLLHATGFHSRCWDSVARRLAGTRIFAVDLRFHGGSDRHGRVDWQLMGRDIEELLARLDLRRVVGVGHSLGGYLTALVGARQQQRFRELVLIDPVILPRDEYHDFPPPDAIDPAQMHVSRRKNRWQSAEEMYQRFRSRPPFDSWQDDVLRDYCRHALRAAPEESSLQLACDPMHEASVYISQHGNDAIYALLPRLVLPVTLLRAPPDPQGAFNLAASPTWPGLVDLLPNAREIYLPGNSHFIPMEDPELVARIIREAVARGER